MQAKNDKDTSRLWNSVETLRMAAYLLIPLAEHVLEMKKGNLALAVRETCVFMVIFGFSAESQSWKSTLCQYGNMNHEPVLKRQGDNHYEH